MLRAFAIAMLITAVAVFWCNMGLLTSGTNWIHNTNLTKFHVDPAYALAVAWRTLHGSSASR